MRAFEHVTDRAVSQDGIMSREEIGVRKTSVAKAETCLPVKCLVERLL